MIRRLFARLGRWLGDDDGRHGLVVWVIAGGIVVLVVLALGPR
ncbi:MAG: hypothetical protein ACPG61_07105 [Paracoccaceae bacterium]